MTTHAAAVPAFILMIFAMTGKITGTRIIVRDTCCASADCAERILFKRAGFQVYEMSGSEFCGVMTIPAIHIVTNMFLMISGIIVVVLVRNHTPIAIIMAGSTLGVDINGTG